MVLRPICLSVWRWRRWGSQSRRDPVGLPGGNTVGRPLRLADGRLLRNRLLDDHTREPAMRLRDAVRQQHLLAVRGAEGLRAVAGWAPHALRREIIVARSFARDRRPRLLVRIRGGD